MLGRTNRGGRTIIPSLLQPMAKPMQRLMICCVLLVFSVSGCENSTVPEYGEAVTPRMDADAANAAAGETADGGRPNRGADKPGDGDKFASEAPAAAANVGSWPNWLGPNHNGVSHERGWKAHLSETGTPIAWRKEVGAGYSSVAVAEGRAYTMGHQGGQEIVTCLDAATGEEKWTHRYSGALVNNLHSGGPGATPTVDGDHVYTLGREGQLYCLRTSDGQVVWSKQLSSELGTALPEWGFTCSPWVRGDALIVEAGRVAALDKHSGKLLWKSKAFRPGYGSPVVFSHGENELVAVLNNDQLLIVSADDGSKVAGYDWETGYATTSTTPIVSGDLFFISSGYNKGCALLRLTGDGLQAVYANQNMRNHMNNSVLWKGHLYGFDGNSNSSRNAKLVCLEHRTGRVKWSARGLGCGSLMLADEKLILLSDKGELVIAEASPGDFKEISRLKVLEATCWTMPVLAGGRIYCRNDAGKLVCVDVRGR